MVQVLLCVARPEAGGWSAAVPQWIQVQVETLRRQQDSGFCCFINDRISNQI